MGRGCVFLDYKDFGVGGRYYMIYRKFQDIQLSGLGLGMMRLPVLDGNDGVVDEAAAAEMIDYA